MKLLLHFLLFFLLSVYASPSAFSADRIALVIGINDYPEDGDLPDLKNCVNDALLMKKTLTTVGFKVTSVENPNLSELDEALTKFESQIKKGDTALVYFAGHGIEFGGNNYLMAGNAKLKARSRLSGEAMKAEIFASAMLLAGAKSSFLFLDCCREKPRDTQWLTRGQKKAGLAEISIDGDIIIGLAAAPGKPALEPDEAGGNSPYALALAKWIPSGLKQGDIFEKVRQEVHQMTGGQQRTWENGSFLESFYFAEGKTGLPKMDKGTANEIAVMKAEIERLKKRAEANAMKRTTTTTSGTFSAGTATRGFTNSLGMKMVPVPGTKVLFCEHETRVQDYAAYAAANSGVDREWKGYEYKGHGQESDHPVLNVSWEDAKAFCAWLSKKEGKEYRLPTDHEWSVAVGIGSRERESSSPQDKNYKIEGVYPWGTQYPPPKGAGNYNGQESDFSYKMEDYRDEYPFTAPVKSFKANQFGIYDLGGNVWEWCEDWYSGEQKYRVLRGGSWVNATETRLRSSYRRSNSPTRRYNYFGFRAVVGAGG